MTKVKIELDCLKDLLKREPIVKVVEALPDKETADLNYIYVVPKEGEGKDTKAYVLRPDRSGYDAIDLTPQVVSVLGEGYITVEKETLNENGDVTFTVKTNETLKSLLDSLGTKNEEQDGKLTNLTDRVVALEGKEDKDTVYDDTALANRVTALEEKPDKDTIYDDSELRGKITALEERPQGSSYDDTELKGRVKALEDKPEPTPYNDKPLSDRVTALEGKTDNFVSNVGVSREGNTVKLTYTMVNGDNKEVEFTDNDTVSMAYDDSALRGRIEALEKKPDKDTVYNDSDLKEQVNDLGSSVASALHDIREIRVNNEQRLNTLESKMDNDKQTLALDGNTLSISNGNSVELPTAPTAKPIKVSSTSEGVTVTPEEEEGTTNYKVNIDSALSKYYDKSKTYTKNEVDNLIVKQEEKATDITVYRGTFTNRELVQEGTFDTDRSPRTTLTYSSSTGVGILKVDFKILKAVGQGAVIAQLPKGSPKPAELIEAQVWLGDTYTSIWMDKGADTVRMYATSDANIFNKRIIINIPGIFKK